MQRVARRFPSGSSRCPHFLVPTGIPHRPLAFPRSSVSALSLRNAPGAGSMPYSGVQGANKDKDRRWFEWHKFRTTSSKYDPYIDFVTTEPRYGMSDVWTQGMDPPQPVFPIDVKGRSKVGSPRDGPLPLPSWLRFVLCDDGEPSGAFGRDCTHKGGTGVPA